MRERLMDLQRIARRRSAGDFLYTGPTCVFRSS